MKIPKHILGMYHTSSLGYKIRVDVVFSDTFYFHFTTDTKSGYKFNKRTPVYGSAIYQYVDGKFYIVNSTFKYVRGRRVSDAARIEYVEHFKSAGEDAIRQHPEVFEFPSLKFRSQIGSVSEPYLRIETAVGTLALSLFERKLILETYSNETPFDREIFAVLSDNPLENRLWVWDSAKYGARTLSTPTIAEVWIYEHVSSQITTETLASLTSLAHKISQVDLKQIRKYRPRSLETLDKMLPKKGAKTVKTMVEEFNELMATAGRPPYPTRDFPTTPKKLNLFLAIKNDMEAKVRAKP